MGTCTDSSAALAQKECNVPHLAIARALCDIHCSVIATLRLEIVN
jgi:hypothetical protein